MLNPTHFSNIVNTAVSNNSGAKAPAFGLDDGVASSFLEKKTPLDQLREGPSKLESEFALGYNFEGEQNIEDFFPAALPGGNIATPPSIDFPFIASGSQNVKPEIATAIINFINNSPALQDIFSVEGDMMYLEPQGVYSNRTSAEGTENSKIGIPLGSIKEITLNAPQTNNNATKDIQFTKDFSIISDLKPPVVVSSNDDGSATVVLNLGPAGSVNMTIEPNGTWGQTINAVVLGAAGGASQAFSASAASGPVSLPVTATGAFVGGVTGLALTATLTDLGYTAPAWTNIFGTNSDSAASGAPSSGSSNSDSDSDNNSDGLTNGGAVTGNISTSDSDNDGISESVTVSVPNASDGSTTFLAVNAQTGVATETVLSADGFDTSYVVDQNATISSQNDENGNFESVTLTISSEVDNTTTETNIDIESNVITETVTENESDSDDDEDNNTNTGNGNTNGGSTNTGNGNTNGGSTNTGNGNSSSSSSGNSGSNTTSTPSAPQYAGFGDGGVS